MRTLYVKFTTLKSLKDNGWPTEIIRFSICDPYYIQCRKDGTVNYNKAGLYRASELIERNNVKIVK